MHWLRLGAIVTLTILLSYASASYSLSRVSPAASHRLQPLASAIAPLRYADRRLPPTMDGVDVEALVALAKKSLRVEPLNPSAIRMLALGSRVDKQTSVTLRYAQLSEKLSRRDGTTNLLLIENQPATSGAELKDILRRYDITLRVNPELSERLYPALVEVIANPIARQAMVPYIQHQSEWTSGMILAALNAQHGPLAIADMLMRSYKGKTVVIPEGVSRRLFDGLFARGEYETMKRLFLRLKETEIEWLASTDFKLAEMQEKYGPMVWQFHNTSDVGAKLISNDTDEKTLLEIYALSGARGVPVKRLMFFNDQKYKISKHTSSRNISDDSEAFWEVKCLSQYSTDPVDNNKVVIATTSKSTAFENCYAALISLKVAGGSNQSGASFTLNNITID